MVTKNFHNQNENMNEDKDEKYSKKINMLSEQVSQLSDMINQLRTELDHVLPKKDNNEELSNVDLVTKKYNNTKQISFDLIPKVESEVVVNDNIQNSFFNDVIEDTYKESSHIIAKPKKEESSSIIVSSGKSKKQSNKLMSTSVLSGASGAILGSALGLGLGLPFSSIGALLGGALGGTIAGTIPSINLNNSNGEVKDIVREYLVENPISDIEEFVERLKMLYPDITDKKIEKVLEIMKQSDNIRNYNNLLIQVYDMQKEKQLNEEKLKKSIPYMAIDFENYKLSNNLRKLMKERNISQEQMGDLLNISRSSVISILQGKTVSLENAFKISRIFQLPIEKIFKFEEVIEDENEEW